jgi:hypothetical protein
MGAKKIPARPYLKPSIEDYKDDYEKIIEACLKNA